VFKILCLAFASTLNTAIDPNAGRLARGANGGRAPDFPVLTVSCARDRMFVNRSFGVCWVTLHSGRRIAMLAGANVQNSRPH
jgi:hypothetical protein